VQESRTQAEAGLGKDRNLIGGVDDVDSRRRIVCANEVVGRQALLRGLSV
jgi:hypothetical protein